jgi:hypothetical protein
MNENSSKTTLLRVFLFTCVISYLYSCTNAGSSKKNNTEKPAASHAVQDKKPASSFSDTLVIDKISAVFYNPDSLQLNKMQAITKKEIYETDVHNCFYLMRNARTVLKKYWPQIHIIESSEYRYLLFIKADNSQTCIDLDTKEDMCGILLFDRKKSLN